MMRIGVGVAIKSVSIKKVRGSDLPCERLQFLNFRWENSPGHSVSFREYPGQDVHVELPQRL